MFSCLDVGVDEDGHLHGAVDHYRDTPLLVHDDLPLLWVGPPVRLCTSASPYCGVQLSVAGCRLPYCVFSARQAALGARKRTACSVGRKIRRASALRLCVCVCVRTTGFGPSLVCVCGRVRRASALRLCVCVCVLCTTGFGPSLVCVCVYDGLLPFGFKARMSRAPRGDLGVCPWPLISR